MIGCTARTYIVRGTSPLLIYISINIIYGAHKQYERSTKAQSQREESYHYDTLSIYRSEQILREKQTNGMGRQIK